MRVEIAGEIFTLADKDLDDSQTIKDLLQSQYVFQSSDEAIPIMVDLTDWRSYLEFLSRNLASEAALKVINYLDNLPQAQRWCDAKYSDILHHISQMNREEDINNAARKKISELVNKLTEFLPDQVLPVRLLTTFQDILTRLQSITTNADMTLTAQEAKHIVRQLFSEYIYEAYGGLIKKSLSTKKSNYINYLTSRMFVLKGIDKSTGNVPVYKDDRRLLRECEISYYHDCYDSRIIVLSGDAEFISPRVAEYYHNIITYDLEGKNYIYCPADKSFLSYYDILRTGLTDTLEITCSTQPVLWSRLKSIDVYSAASKYRPNQGFATDIKIKHHTDDYNTEYDLLSYNQPSAYGRDFYIYLPYEFDPIVRIVYAFSV